MMKAYDMDDEPTTYVADSAEEAAALYEQDSGEPVDDGYPRELTDAELDMERTDYDEDERPTGKTTTIRRWLEAATEPGYLCGALR